MTGENKGKPSGRESQDSEARQDDKTPNTDMQAEDAGTAVSGNDARGTATGSVMKQTSKSGAESGGKL